MEKKQHIIGADLSKKSIDLHHYPSGSHLVIENGQKGFKDYCKWIKQLKVNVEDMLIVMEHTGLYSYCFEQFLHANQIPFAKVHALVIKRYQGFVRGKSDRIDAARIAKYGYDKCDELIAEKAVNQALQRLQHLSMCRERLVKSRASLTCTVKELNNIGLSKDDDAVKSLQKTIHTHDQQIALLESKMQELIKKDEAIHRNYELLLSIKGVGKVLALATIITTRNFTRFRDARKFACYSGTAPFEHSSGTSIRKKTRVSHLADKKMKTLLDLSAKSAIQHNKEMKEYYLRRIEQGKPKMSTINVVRNKIIYRMFAVIKRQTPFIDNYLYAA